MSATCALCGQGPTRQGMYGDFFGGNADGKPLHHDWDRITVGLRANGTPIKVTCYEAWTVYGQRSSVTIKLDPADVPGIAKWMQAVRDELTDELDCGA